MKIPVTIIIPTLNEERNIEKALRSTVEWADQVFVVDSFSSDRTCELATSLSGKVVQHRFLNYSAQKNWALDNLPVRTDWVFFLDADEAIPPDLRDEIASVVRDQSATFAGYYVGMEHLFLGARLRHGGWYPNFRLLFFRHQLGRYETRIVHEHLVLQGPTGKLKQHLVHDDRKGLHRYFDRHNVYSTMEALAAYRLTREDSEESALFANWFGEVPQRRRAIKQWAYRYLPCRPLFKFLWAYFLKRGFLDGRMGFTYCMLQSFYEFQVSLKLRELRNDPASPLLSYSLAKAAENHPAEPIRDSKEGVGLLRAHALRKSTDEALFHRKSRP